MVTYMLCYHNIVIGKMNNKNEDDDNYNFIFLLELKTDRMFGRFISSTEKKQRKTIIEQEGERYNPKYHDSKWTCVVHFMAPKNYALKSETVTFFNLSSFLKY